MNKKEEKWTQDLVRHMESFCAKQTDCDRCVLRFGLDNSQASCAMKRAKHLFTQKKVIDEMLRREYEPLEEMARAMMKVKRPEWDIVQIRTRDVTAMAFVRKDKQKPPFMEEV